MFDKVLIANRGEIARRIQRTCSRLGIRTIAIYSDLDAGALHVQEADEAYCVGGARPDESYLRADRIIQIAKDAGADAIHPGYGFLSENAEFADACQAAGINFVGPTAQTIRQMGSKAQAKALMAAAGIPVVPGYHGIDQDEAMLRSEADRIGFPLMIKAAAGGGGKGMRIVHEQDKFDRALASARREAAGAFGDDAVILERYLMQPRHIEFQILGDKSGEVVHLFERDCSTQRRYQKVIEEAPSPFISKKQRRRMAEAAVNSAKAVQYHNAGTIEFIVDQSGEFFFMEMNTRLQVEHPVTELILGLDLVEWQLRVAAGESLPTESFPPPINGHAVEVRIYAENPAAGFMPSTGTLQAFEFPDSVRVDSAVTAGDAVTVHYDPMLAKVIAHGPNRAAAVSTLSRSLAAARVSGVQTNLSFLLNLLDLPEFAAGDIHTAFLDWHLDEVIEQARTVPDDVWLIAAIAQLQAEETAASLPGSADAWSPWNTADAWRLGHPGKRMVALTRADQTIELTAYGNDGRYAISIDDVVHHVLDTHRQGHEVTVNLADRSVSAWVHQSEDDFTVSVDGSRFELKVASPFAYEPVSSGGADQIIAPMPGRIISVESSVGDIVEAGQDLIVMEAMKMEISLKAESTRVIESVHCTVDQLVEADSVLLKFAVPEE